MKAYLKRCSIPLLLILFFLEVKAVDKNSIITNIIQSAQKQYAPDDRTAVFNISYRITKAGIVLSGEVDNSKAKKALIRRLDKNIILKIIDSIQVLPDTALNSFRNGIVVKTVVDVHKNPHKPEELTTQVLMGTVTVLLKKSGGYYFIRMPDGYLGWIDTSSVYPVDQNILDFWNTSPKVIVVKLECAVHASPDSNSIPLFYTVAGCVLLNTGYDNGWTAVKLADGRTGFIQGLFIQDYDEWKNSRSLTGENLEKTAKELLGIPYIWGGTSIKGMDCSGFTKIVYRMNGVELHRDSDQQAEQGIPVNPGKNFENLQKGDLLFFTSGKKEKQAKNITHVGLSLGKGLFIHSSMSKSVRISSLDSSSVYFEKPLLEMFVLARRIIKTDSHNTIQN
ncbi:MAG: C40 family peptidase [Bacteroidetes bacterium]|nr:C40 family peptidase [Bacteroidota bacterium]